MSPHSMLPPEKPAAVEPAGPGLPPQISRFERGNKLRLVEYFRQMPMPLGYTLEVRLTPDKEKLAIRCGRTVDGMVAETTWAIAPDVRDTAATAETIIGMYLHQLGYDDTPIAPEPPTV